MVTMLLNLVFASIMFATPEGKIQQNNNPLLTKQNTPFSVPAFHLIKPEHYKPAFDEAIKQNKAEIEKIVNNPEPPTFKNTIEPYLYSGELLRKVSSIFYNTNACNTNSEIQKISEEIAPILSAHKDEINMNKRLFEKIKTVYENMNNENLTNEQKFLLENIYRNFIKNGVLLNEEQKKRLQEINQRLSVLTVKYNKNVLAETNSFELIVTDYKDIEKLPESAIKAAKEIAVKKGKKDAWIFTTQKPSMIPFLQYSTNRKLRERLYNAYVNRGNNNDEYDNKKIIQEIVLLRQEKAKILGYQNYAAYRLEERMAETPERVFELLDKIWVVALDKAKEELNQMQEIANAEGENVKIEAYDWMYYAEKLRNTKYNLDENELRPYFRLENVRDAIFEVAKRLYGLTFTKIKNIPLPHPDAVAFEVKEEDGKHVGVLYLDFFPRESKRGGAWCTLYETYHVKDGKIINPIVSIVCNFSKPTKDTPSLLSIDEVETFFHEFGHALEALLSKKTYPVSFVAQDFVELPSQIMEHWAFQDEVIKLYAYHYQTKKLISEDLIKKIRNSMFFNQGFATTEYLAASYLDMALHTMYFDENFNIEEFEKEYLYKKLGLIPEIDPRYRSTYFTHIMGGYDAGYYSYIWSAVLDNDAFELFKTKGIFNKETAISFRKNILEKDGIEPPLKMYINFKGQEPDITPLLKNRGLL